MKKFPPIAGLLLFIFAASLGVLQADDSFQSNKESSLEKEKIVLIHGLGRSNVSMWMMDRRLEKAGFDVLRVGYDSLRQTPEEILVEISQQLNGCCTDLDQRLHFVGHSLGGLVIRAYLAEQQVKNLGQVVLIGTPNKGTPVVDLFQDKWWMKFAGPTANALGTDKNGFPQSLPAPKYSVGVIAGVVERGPMTKHIPGADDGVVPVDSTRVDGMRDFIVIDTSHTMMRYNDEVLRQTVEFLRYGHFDRSPKPDASPDKS